jgi:hypothetical protein
MMVTTIIMRRLLRNLHILLHHYTSEVHFQVHGSDVPFPEVAIQGIHAPAASLFEDWELPHSQFRA